jgi:hypothetical protein
MIAKLTGKKKSEICMRSKVGGFDGTHRDGVESGFKGEK